MLKQIQSTMVLGLAQTSHLLIIDSELNFIYTQI